MSTYPDNSAPGLHFLCRIKASVAQMVSLGALPHGERRYVPIVGGVVETGVA